ncbi:MAG: ISNCY family transposase [Bryobacterales bacterium]|nr:ISNCY family transposase [Bryobacterales bacterium]
MRVIHNPQFSLGQIPIEDLQFDPCSRDDIPAILQGIQFIYCDSDLRHAIFDCLEQHILKPSQAPQEGPDSKPDSPAVVDPSNGRPGMDLWDILVLGLLKQGLNCDCDRLAELANRHLDVRRMLGLSEAADSPPLHWRTVNRNLQLLTPELLAEINQLVVQAGHALAGHAPQQPLAARCDSFVVETDVHYPTDVSLLWDALRCLLRSVAAASGLWGVRGWRQKRAWLWKLKTLFNRVRSSKQRGKRPERVELYVRQAERLAGRARVSPEALESAGCGEATRSEIEGYVELVERLAEQVRRRVLKGETIPQEEKLFSIFAPHTRWCAKGKAGRAVELGVPVTIVESEYQFLLHGKVMWSEADVDVAAQVIEETQAEYPELEQCSFDKGYHSPANQQRLGELLKENVLPRKGKLSKAAQEREGEAVFQAARKAHPAVESAINNLERRGLDRVREQGSEGFERMVWLGMLAANLHRIGCLVRNGKRERLRRKGVGKAA